MQDYYWSYSQKAKHAKSANAPEVVVAEVQTALGEIEAFLRANQCDFGDPKNGENADRCKRRMLAAAKQLTYRCREFRDAVIADDQAANIHS